MFGKDGRKKINNIVAGFTKTVSDLEIAIGLNSTKMTEHTQEIEKRNADISDLERHNQIADKLKKNLTTLIS